MGSPGFDQLCATPSEKIAGFESDRAADVIGITKY
jgi:hypothetical protein